MTTESTGSQQATMAHSRQTQEQGLPLMHDTELDSISTSIIIDVDTLRPRGGPLSQPSKSTKTYNRLYVSHTLSTFNSRTFEFGATLFLAHIFPSTLLPISLYAVVRGLSAVLLSPSVGRHIDHAPRLRVVRDSVVYQRAAVALSCAILYLMSRFEDLGLVIKYALLALLAVVACVEKLCSIMNLVAVERDWVVVIAEGDDAKLRGLNAQMRRIDLCCKLLGPFMIGVVDGYFGTKVAILLNLAMNVLSLPVEWYAIRWVWESTPALQSTKAGPVIDTVGTTTTSLPRTWVNAIKQELGQLRSYLNHPAMCPSLAGSLLYFTVLSFSGQMVTFLLSVGFSSIIIAFTRTVSVCFEISATWLAPLVTQRIGAVRAGIWFLSWQMLCLAGGVGAFLMLGQNKAQDESAQHEQPQNRAIYAATALVVGTILSRIGLWGFDLSSQTIVQEEVEAGIRGSFSAVEASMQNGFELCSFLTTIVFSRPDQFRWPVMASCASVYAAGLLYASFVRTRRGHLVHFCEGHHGPSKRKLRGSASEAYDLDERLFGSRAV